MYLERAHLAFLTTIVVLVCKLKERQKDSLTVKRTDRHTEGKPDSQKETLTNRKTNRQKDRQTEDPTDRRRINCELRDVREKTKWSISFYWVNSNAIVLKQKSLILAITFI